MLYSLKKNENIIPVKDGRLIFKYSDLELVEDRFEYKTKTIGEEYLKECKASENSEFE